MFRRIKEALFPSSKCKRVGHDWESVGCILIAKGWKLIEAGLVEDANKIGLGMCDVNLKMCTRCGLIDWEKSEFKEELEAEGVIRGIPAVEIRRRGYSVVDYNLKHIISREEGC